MDRALVGLCPFEKKNIYLLSKQKKKMANTPIKRLNAKVIAFLLFMISLSIASYGQNLAQINARFANPQFDFATRTYFLDVEISTKGPNHFLFGMNVRFFYDAGRLQFLYLDQLHGGYTLTGKSPQSYVGNPQSGAKMFGLTGAAAYVNGIVQLQSTRV